MSRQANAAGAAGIVLLTLASGQFLMTLDSSVMNVSIATVAEDVGTDVTGIQTAIAALRAALSVLALISLLALFSTGRLPTRPTSDADVAPHEAPA